MNGLSIAGYLTAEQPFLPLEIETLHSKTESEEKFFRALETHRAVYFDWGCHSLHVFIGNGTPDEDPKNWAAIGGEKFAELVQQMAITSTDLIVLLIESNIRVYICDTEKFGPKPQQHEGFLQYLRQIVPCAEVFFA